MKKKITIKLLLGFFLFFGLNSFFSQAIITPDWGNTICASTTFNNFQLRLNNGTVPAGTTISIEISNTNTFATLAATITPSPNVTSGATTTSTFAIPTNFPNGTGYFMRVKFGNGVTTAPYPSTGSLTIFYKVWDKEFFFDVPSSANFFVCADASGNFTYNLRIKNEAAVNDSPADFPVLKYKWYKDGVLIAGQSGTSIVVTAEGSYFAEIDYGTACATSIAKVQTQLKISKLSNSNLTIKATPPSFCPGTTVRLESNVVGSFTYKWFKVSGTTNTLVATISSNPAYIISNATAANAGQYIVEVDTGNGMGGCVATSGPTTISIVDINPTLSPTTTATLVPGVNPTLTVTPVTTNAPSYVWKLNNNVIAGATSATYIATTVGQYCVTVSQTTPCAASKELCVNLVKPSEYVVTINGGGFMACSSSSGNLSLGTVTAKTLNGTTAGTATVPPSAITSYKWLVKNASNMFVEVSPALNAPSIPIGSTYPSGTYRLQLVLSNGDTPQSEPFNANVKGTETFTIATMGDLCDAAAQLPINLTTNPTTLDLNNYTIKWFKDGTEIATGNTFSASQPGTYQVKATSKATECVFESNVLSVKPILNNITFDKPSQIFFPPGTTSISITGSGATSYTWLNPSNTFISTTSTANITSIGKYKCVAKVESCEFTYEFDVTSSPNVFNDEIPNLISPNNDGINDKWFIPNKIFDGSKINVQIYDNLGKEVYVSDNYQNNWPTDEISKYNTNTVFYYILKNSKSEYKGTITVLK